MSALPVARPLLLAAIPLSLCLPASLHAQLFTDDALTRFETMSGTPLSSSEETQWLGGVRSVTSGDYDGSWAT